MLRQIPQMYNTGHWDLVGTNIRPPLQVWCFVQDEQTLVEDKPTMQCGSFSAEMQLTSDEANWMKVNTWRGDNEDKVAGPRPSLISLESKRPPGTFAHRTSFTKSQAGQKGPAGGGEGSFYSHSSFSCHRHQGRFLKPDEICFCQCFVISRGGNWLQSQLPSSRIYGDYSFIIAINSSFSVNNRARSAAECHL